LSGQNVADAVSYAGSDDQSSSAPDDLRHLSLILGPDEDDQILRATMSGLHGPRRLPFAGFSNCRSQEPSWIGWSLIHKLREIEVRL
jgi:hypothetical protein